MNAQTTSLITPYGGKLVDLVLKGDERDELLKKAGTYPTVRLTPRQTHDLELLAVGAFSPLDRFMGSADYKAVLDEMKLADGTVWPMPITLTIHKEDLPEQDHWVTLRMTAMIWLWTSRSVTQWSCSGRSSLWMVSVIGIGQIVPSASFISANTDL